MAFPMDNSDVTTATEQLISQLNGQVKQHIVLDAQARQKFIFTAPIHTEEGGPCLVTEYVYKDASSTQIINRQERSYKWKAVWDSLFTFDPTASYDADGNGIL